MTAILALGIAAIASAIIAFAPLIAPHAAPYLGLAIHDPINAVRAAGGAVGLIASVLFILAGFSKRGGSQWIIFGGVACIAFSFAISTLFVWD